MGLAQGLMLGVLARVVSWGLDREKAAAALGVLLGAYGGVMRADLYYPRLYSYATGIGLASPGTLSLYALACGAYLGALAASLLVGKRRSPGR